MTSKSRVQTFLSQSTKFFWIKFLKNFTIIIVSLLLLLYFYKNLILNFQKYGSHIRYWGKYDIKSYGEWNASQERLFYIIARYWSCFNQIQCHICFFLFRSKLSSLLKRCKLYGSSTTGFYQYYFLALKLISVFLPLSE